jgi:hypothetical protein
MNHAQNSLVVGMIWYIHFHIYNPKNKYQKIEDKEILPNSYLYFLSTKNEFRILNYKFYSHITQIRCQKKTLKKQSNQQ